MFLLLGTRDLLAWAAIINPESGWFIRLMGADWVQPLGGLIMAVTGVIWSWKSLVFCFAVRDESRRKARRGAFICAFITGAALAFALETLLPSASVLAFDNHLTTEARRAGLVGLIVAVASFAGFVLLRRRDVGFWTVSLPMHRDNEIWRLMIKADVAFRALPENEEVYQLFKERSDFVLANIGAKFDKLCQQIIKDSADLSTIDSTARLQMDVGHIFRLYADFHTSLAETRNRLCDELIKITNEALVDVLENKLPGESVRVGVDQDVRLSVSCPVLQDTEGLKRRRTEWDEILRGIVSDSAATGNQIIGEWIERAARGDITAEEMPRAVNLIRSLCGRSESSAILELPVNATVTPTLGFPQTARELADWVGKEASIEDPHVARRVRTFFSERRLMLQDCESPERSAEQMMEYLRSDFGGMLTLRSIAAALTRRAA